ncbi:hypothetical protein BD626DRAFT_137113 [Schizophyllum amplum]|uniref:ICE2-domain-containing protein n=1 Tax=Schizophyllum amplum TaxID=97359 RepID=A0A550C5W7_9AGAR|nr:hypothetical protein BD626DRAFT_137113 [Auriculariopsis ampla]
MNNYWLLWSAISHTARLSTVLQILIFLPLTLVTLSKSAFLLLSLLLTCHSLIHGTLIAFWGSQALSLLQVPMHPFLLLVCFNVFSSPVPQWLESAAGWWGTILTYFGPGFWILESVSSLLVAQKLGQEGKRLVSEADGYQLSLLITSASAYVVSAWWYVSSYPAAATSPLSATLLGVAPATLFFLTFIGFTLRRTNIIESAGMALFLAYNVWLCGYDQSGDAASSSASAFPVYLSYFDALINFVMNTLPKPVLIALLYRLTILHLASRILPTIGADSWESVEGVDEGWDGRPTSTLTRILLTYRQFIFVTVYTHLLLLDNSSQIWWRWLNIFFTLIMWAVELLVSPDDDPMSSKDWKID